MKKRVDKLFCHLGWHNWEKDPSKKEPVKGTGRHIIFCSSGIQKGVRHCTRPDCKCTQKVYREGMCGIGGIVFDWKKLEKKKADWIDSLPGVFQS